MIYWGPEQHNYVKIYYPTSLEEATLTSRYGNIAVNGLTCKKLKVVGETCDLKLNNITAEEEISTVLEGNMKLDQVKSSIFTVEGEAGNLQFSQVSTEDLFQVTWNYGDVNLEKISADKLVLHTESGNVQIDEFEAAESKINVTYGDVKAIVSGDKSEYQYHLISEYNDIWFDGSKYSHEFTREGTGEKKVMVSVESGTIQMN